MHTRTIVAALILMAAAFPMTASASHAMTEMRKIMDTGVAIVVTDDGLPHDVYPHPFVMFSAAEYVARFEHPDDPLAALPNLVEDEERAAVLRGELPPGTGGDVVWEEVYAAEHTSAPFSIFESGAYRWKAGITPAFDSAHAPPNGCNYSKTNTGLQRFQAQFSDLVDVTCYASNFCYSASGIGDDAGQLLDRLASEIGTYCSFLRDANNEVVIGWVDFASNNGIAYGDGFFTVAAEEASGVDWDHDEIIQHEVSHLFNALDRGTWWWEGDGIMNYWDAEMGVTTWETADWNTVKNNIWACLCSGSQH